VGTPRVDCVGGIVVDERGRLLLVRRGTEPGRGLWSVPGGRVEPGESDAEATAREVLEETGLRVRVGPLAGTVERPAPTGGVYVIRDHWCTPEPGADPDEVRAGDDADECAWFSPEELRALDCVPGLVDAFVEWRVL
jgi:8-oxo-dGTP diphosphatase